MRWVLRIAGCLLVSLGLLLMAARQSTPQSPWVAFQSERAGQWDIYLIRPQTSQLYQITDTPMVDERLPTWSPEGGWLAYEVQQQNLSVIYKQQLWGKNRQRVTSKDQEHIASLRWSPDGKWLAYVDTNENMLYRIPSNGGESEPLLPIIHYFPDSAMLDWSPDSQSLVYISQPPTPPQNNALFVFDLQTRSSTRLTFHNTTDMTPLWGNENWIFFSSYTRSSYELYRIRADGSELERITKTAWDELHSHLSPDGQWLAVASWQPRDLEIYQMRPDGTERHRLTDSAGQDYAPLWSPIINLRWRWWWVIGLGIFWLGVSSGRRRSLV